MKKMGCCLMIVILAGFAFPPLWLFIPLWIAVFALGFGTRVLVEAAKWLFGRPEPAREEEAGLDSSGAVE